MRAFDAWLRPQVLAPGWLVDVGFGVSAVTTWEWAQAFPERSVIGLERDAARVESAAREFPTLTLRAGSLEVLDAQAAVIRVANVARGLTLDEALAVPAQASPHLVDGGLLLEGSTDERGELTAFFVQRKRGAVLEHVSLVFHSTFTRGFAPWQLRDVLPRALRRDVRPGTPIAAFFEAWDAAWRQVRTADPKASFVLAAERLAERGAAVAIERRGEGFLEVAF